VADEDAASNINLLKTILMNAREEILRIAIIEDDSIYGSELNLYFSHQPEVISTALYESVENFLKPPVLWVPDIILLDVGLPGIDGISAIPLIRAEYPQADIIMLTIFSDHQTIFNALCSGAVGYVLKESMLTELRGAIRVVAMGGSYMSPSIARKVISYFVPIKDSCTDGLTGRERDVVNGLVDGLSYKLIADRLNIKVTTVQGYIKNIYRKMNANSKTEVVRKLKNSIFH
jgi:DNA-binding NarL/FixJ family response regulator